MSGGMNAPDPSTYGSGSSYGMAVNGTVDQQFNNVFDQNGPDGKFQSNSSVGLQGQNVGPSPSASYKMTGGKRKRTRKNKKGGFLGSILNQAIVPFTLVGLNQKASKMFKKR